MAHQARDCNILSYALSGQQAQQWTSATNPSKTITTASARLLIQRLASGFDRMRLAKGATILLIAPTSNIFTPIVYLATVGSGRIFVHASPTSNLAAQMQAAQPSLVLADPTVWERVLEAGVNRDRVFSFDEEDYSDPGKDILDWKVLMARPSDGKQWTWEAMDEAKARETVAVVDYSGSGEGVRLSHYDVLVNARQNHAFGMTPSDAVLPWRHRDVVKRDIQRERNMKL